MVILMGIFFILVATEKLNQFFGNGLVYSSQSGQRVTAY